MDMDAIVLLEYVIAAINTCVVILCVLLYGITRAWPFLIVALSHSCSLIIRVLVLCEPGWNGGFMADHSRILNFPTHVLALIGYWYLYRSLKRHYFQNHLICK